MTAEAQADAPSYRYYRLPRDGSRCYFTPSLDRQIPLVDGVTVLCCTRDEVATLLEAAALNELTAKVRTPRAPGPARFAVVISSSPVTFADVASPGTGDPLRDGVAASPGCSSLSARCVMGECGHRAEVAS